MIGLSQIGRPLFASSAIRCRSDVAAKILHHQEVFGHQRFLLQMTVGSLPHEQVLRSIELFGTEVAPLVREQLEQQLARLSDPGVTLAALAPLRNPWME